MDQRPLDESPKPRRGRKRRFLHNVILEDRVWGDWMLVVDESVKLEKQLVEIQNSRKITDQYEGIHGIYPVQ